ncbi:FAD/NAD(P)-binding protein [Tsukamurella sp. M9C]|uniref:FAD/NAD(P)-binding protein n=1 Tax=Tsukamurella sp. M9C TaxID=2877520 RepID=UPI001CCE9184|nr:FAD/NAD(P)-binding protein [Tsukamurella sp. M9C]
MVSVGIVGGGAAAVSLLRQLPVSDDLSVSVYADRVIGPGRAYAEESDSALLNRQAFAMSISAEEPDEFVDWCRANEPELLVEGGHSFVPRWAYGRYLRQCTQARAVDFGDSLTRITGRVTDAAREGDVWRLVVHRPGFAPETYRHDVVVLALGSSPPADPYRLEGTEHYTQDPYPVDEWLPTVLAGESAAVIGTGLSAIDVALAVRSRSWDGRLLMASRQGILPDVRSDLEPLDFDPDVGALIRRVQLKHGGLEWEDVVNIVDYLAVGEGLRRSEVRAAFRAITEPAGPRLAGFAGRPVSIAPEVQRLVICVAQYYANDLWSAMTRSARSAMVASVHAPFQALANPLPARSAQVLGDMVVDGALTVRHGVRDVAPSASGLVVSSADGDEAVQHVVNATRTPAGAPSGAAASLVSSLVYGGTARRNPYGGLRINVADNAIVGRDGTSVPGLYALGEIASGDLYYISSIAKIRRRARAVARSIAERVNPAVPQSDPMPASVAVTGG